jgi:hypothetical protein
MYMGSLIIKAIILEKNQIIDNKSTSVILDVNKKILLPFINLKFIKEISNGKEANKV